MPQKKDVLTSFHIPGRKRPLCTGGGARRSKETREQFFKRLVSEMPAIFLAVRGQDFLVARYFGIELRLVMDLAEQVNEIMEARSEALGIYLSAKQDGLEAAKQLEALAVERVTERPEPPTKKKWPKAAKKRRQAIRKFLIDDGALVKYEGDLATLSDSCLIPPAELLEIMEGDSELQSLRDLGLKVQAMYLESKLLATARSSSRPNDIKNVLKNLHDLWSDRQQVEVTHTTFEAPPADLKLAPVISLLKKDGTNDTGKGEE